MTDPLHHSRSTLARSTLVLAGLAFAAAGCASPVAPVPMPVSAEASPSAPQQSLGDVFGSRSDMSTWLSMSVQGNYFQELSGSSPHTVFAPVNSAFNKVPANLVLQDLKGTGSMSMPNIPRTQSVIRNQVVNGAIPPGALKDGAVFMTLSGQRIVVRGTGTGMTLTMTSPRVGTMNLGGVETARLVGPPVMATNGIVYPVDTLFTR